MRRARIKRNKPWIDTPIKHRVRRKLAVCDCETDPFEYPNVPRPFLWAFYSGEEIKYFDSTEKFVEFIRPQKLELYAHNGGKFDFLFLEKYFPKPAFPLLINGRIVSLDLTPTCRLLDSYALYAMPLGMTGEKSKIEWWKLKEKNRGKYMPEIKRYCGQDCIALFELLIQYRETLGKATTHAGACYKILKKLCQVDFSCSYEWDRKIRPFYFGGRTEVFKTEYGFGKMMKGWILDINSAYPYAMTFKHPSDTEKGVEVFHFNKTGVGFYEVRAESVGAFPFRMPDGRLSFPLDGETRDFKVTSWEIKSALKVNPGMKIEILRGYHYSDLVTFRPFVDHFFEIKKNSEKGSVPYQLAKLAMNGGYGRAGMDVSEHKQRVLIPKGKSPDDFKDELRKRFGHSFKEWKDRADYEHYTEWEREVPAHELKFVNVACAASITGFVRAYLYESIAKCKNVAYCDTDSIFCEEHNLPVSKKLGEWDIEAEVKRVSVGGKKLYAVELADGSYKVRSKGAKLSVNQVLKVCDEGKEIRLTGRNSRLSASILSGFQWREKTIRRTV